MHCTSQALLAFYSKYGWHQEATWSQARIDELTSRDLLAKVTRGSVTTAAAAGAAAAGAGAGRGHGSET